MKKTTYKICWKVNKYRRDKRVGALSPIKRSNYIKKLFIEIENRMKD